MANTQEPFKDMTHEEVIERLNQFSKSFKTQNIMPTEIGLKGEVIREPLTGEDAFINRISEEIANNFDLKDLPIVINKLKDRLTVFLLNLIEESENQRIRQDKHHHFLNDILNKITNNE